MTNFKINDLVKIIKDPPNQIVKIKGEIGYIEELQEQENKEGNIIKYAYFKTIEMNSFCGGIGSVPLDCIEICTDERYIKRFQEILEHQRKEDEKYKILSDYRNLESNLEDSEKTLIKLKAKLELLGTIFNLLTPNLTDNGQLLLRFEMDLAMTEINKTENILLKIKDEMSTPVNINAKRYSDYLRYG